MSRSDAMLMSFFASTALAVDKMALLRSDMKLRSFLLAKELCVLWALRSRHPGGPLLRGPGRGFEFHRREGLTGCKSVRDRGLNNDLDAPIVRATFG